ncbi:MAG: tetratricopeptide repeat protein [Reyranellales bacterium]|jgi:putative thioredoxin
MEPMLKGAAPAAPLPADLIKDSDQTKFAKDVLEASRTVPVIVDFWAPWCGPCKTLQPMIEKVVTEAKGAVKLVKIDIDKNQMLAQQLRIQSIPAVYAFFGGRPVDGFMGAVPESQVREFVGRLVQASGGAAGDGADDLSAALEHATQAIADGDFQLAAQIYNEVLEVAPDNLAAMAGLARCYAHEGQAEQARAVLAKVPTKDKGNADIVAILAQLDLAEAAKAAGPIGELKAKAEKDPKDFQTRLDLAMAYWAGEQKQEAIDELLAMIKADRNWNEAAARAQLLKFFEALGFTDPLAVAGRKRLSTILFS